MGRPIVDTVQRAHREMRENMTYLGIREYKSKGISIYYKWCEPLMAYVHDVYYNDVHIASSKKYIDALSFGKMRIV